MELSKKTKTGILALFVAVAGALGATRCPWLQKQYTDRVAPLFQDVAPVESSAQ